MDQSIMNVVDINPIQILLTSLLEFKLERHSRNISSILKGYVMSSVPIAPFSGLPRCLLFQEKRIMCPHWHACVSGLVLEVRLSVILRDFMALLTLGFVFFYLCSQFVDVLFSQDRTQNNSWSTDNVRPEWPLDRPKISLASHVDQSRLLPFLNKQPNPHLGIRFWLLLKKQSLYCAFHKHANSEVQKLTDDCVFRCRQSS